jgi:hypothetical protein
VHEEPHISFSISSTLSSTEHPERNVQPKKVKKRPVERRPDRRMGRR